MEGIIERDNWEALEYFYQYPEPTGSSFLYQEEVVTPIG